MKACPICAREIQDAAIKCRYCGNWLTAAPTGMPPPPVTGTPSLAPAPIIRQTTTSGLAIASLVLGLLWVYWIGSVLALCFGYAARSEIRRNPDRIDGGGMAIAGIVLGWVGIGMLAVIIVYFVYALKASQQRPDTRRTKTTATVSIETDRRRFHRAGLVHPITRPSA